MILQSTKDIFCRNVLVPLILIVMLGLVLRFYGLGNQSLSFEEIVSWNIAKSNSLSGVIKGLDCETRPPAYDIILHYIVKYIGDSESLLRLPSAIFGALLIPVIFLLGCLFYSYKEGLIASALLVVSWSPTISWSAIFHSQTARNYSMLLLFSALSMYFWLRILLILDKKEKLFYIEIAGYIVTAIISAYTHYFGLYFIALQCLGLILFFITRPKSLIQVFLVYCLIAIAYLPWLSNLLYQTQHNYSAIGWIPYPTKTVFTNFFRFLFSNARIPLAIILIPCLFLLIRNMHYILKNNIYKNMREIFLSKEILLVLWLAIPFMGAYIISILWHPVLHPRNLIISLPAIYLLFSRAIVKLPFSWKNKVVIVSILASFSLYDLIFLKKYYSKPCKAQIREAVSYIIDHKNLYKGFLIVGSSWFYKGYSYYFEKKGFEDKVIYDLPWKNKENIQDIDVIICRESPRYLWYMCAEATPNFMLLKLFNNNFKVGEHKKFFDAQTWLFENKVINNP